MPEQDARAMLDAANTMQYPAGAWLYRQGDAAREFYALESGFIRLSHVTPAGEDILLRFVAPGDVLGYLSLGPPGAHRSSAQILKPSRISVWQRETAVHLAESMPRLAFNLFNIAARDVRYYFDRGSRIQSQRAGERIRWAMAELVRILGRPTTTGGLIAPRIRLQEVAQLAGTTTSTACRELRRLEDSGILRRDRLRIVVPQPKRLVKWLAEW